MRRRVSHAVRRRGNRWHTLRARSSSLWTCGLHVAGDRAFIRGIHDRSRFASHAGRRARVTGL